MSVEHDDALTTPLLPEFAAKLAEIFASPL
jgi:hypothetical protein